jgi:hypothetical protein
MIGVFAFSLDFALSPPVTPDPSHSTFHSTPFEQQFRTGSAADTTLISLKYRAQTLELVPPIASMHRASQWVQEAANAAGNRRLRLQICPETGSRFV